MGESFPGAVGCLEPRPVVRLLALQRASSQKLARREEAARSGRRERCPRRAHRTVVQPPVLWRVEGTTHSVTATASPPDGPKAHRVGVVIAEDDTPMRTALAALLSAEPGLEVLGVAA